MSQRKTVLLALFALVCALFVAAPVAFAADDAESYGAGKSYNNKTRDPPPSPTTARSALTFRSNPFVFLS